MGSIPLPALHVQPPQVPDPLESYGRVLALKSAMQGQQQQQLQLTAGQMEIDSQKAIMRAYSEAGGNLEKALPLAAQYGAKPDTLVKLRQAAIEQHKANIELLNTQGDRALREADLMSGAHDTIAAAPAEQRPAVYQAQLQGLAKAGVDVSQVPPQYPGDQAFQLFGIALKGHKQQLDELAKSTEIRKNKAQAEEAEAAVPGKQAQSEEQVRANVAAQLAGAKDQADYEARLGELPYKLAKQFPQQFDKDAVLAAGMTPHEQASVPMDKQEAKTWLGNNPGKNLNDYQVWKAKNASPMSMVTNMNMLGPSGPGSGTDQAAEKYFQTGELPAGFARSPATTAAIIKRSAELHPDANLAANKAVYTANKESLKAMQKNRDAVEAFENAAGKNLDLFLQQAKKVVDAGAPWINAPLRSLDKNLLGSSDMPAYEAARQVALTEIAKVTSNPGLTGVLSDEARKEIQSFNPSSATLKQTLEVARVLRQDMLNRKQAYDGAITEIQKRMGSTPSGTGGGQAAGGAVKITLPSGKTITVE